MTVIHFYILPSYYQCAVKAATEGRVLVLEGIEKAERNVLPVLNNLLENREMQLEDGRFLCAAQRYDKLLKVRAWTNMWHDQEEGVGCRRCCFWDIVKNKVWIPLFCTVFSIVKSFKLCNQISNCNVVCIKMKHFVIS